MARPLCPSLVAVIVTGPTATPVTNPPVETVAIPKVLDAQVTERPASTLPLASLSVALSCTVAPTDTPVAAGLSVTEATGGGGGGGGGPAPRGRVRTGALPRVA